MRFSKKVRWLTRLACVVLVATLACSMATSVQGLDVVWEQVSADAGFAGRDSPAYTVHDGQMWIMGGTSGSVYNDVWSSADGETWTEATPAASWQARNLPVGLSYDDKLWIMSGYGRVPGLAPLSDVWSSTDSGVTWTQATSSAAWGTRGGASGVVFDGKMWMMGGSDYDGSTFNNKNDVWYSTDGASWTQATASAAWNARSYASVVSYDGKMWLYGGSAEGSGVLHNDVWSSTDGVTWNPVTAAAPWSARSLQGAAVYDNKMWVTAGYDGGLLGDTWSSADGVNWEQANAVTGQWSKRYAPAVMSHDEKLWVVAGYSGALHNDVWAYDKTVAPPDPVPPNSMVLNWDMDTLNGDDVADTTVYGNDGTLEVISELGTITRVETGGPFAASPAYYDLQPASEDTLGVRINGGNAWNLNAQSENYSVSVWFKDVGSSPFGEMVSRYEVSSDGNYYLAYDGAGGVAMFHRPPGGVYNYATTPITGDLSDWHHAVGVFEEGIGTTVWVDGVAGPTDSTVTTPIGLVTDLFLVGAEGTPSDNRYPFDGGLDEVKLFNYALSEQEIIALLQTNSTAPLGGDFDLNGAVDVTDLGILATYYGTASGADWSIGDANFDGAVDVTDLGILATNYGTGTVVGAGSVPEPSMGLLIFAGLLTLCLRGRCR